MLEAKLKYPLTKVSDSGREFLKRFRCLLETGCRINRAVLNLRIQSAPGASHLLPPLNHAAGKAMIEIFKEPVMNSETDLMSQLRHKMTHVAELPYSMKPSVLRFIVKILRHRVVGHSLETDSSGWATASDVLEAVNQEFRQFIHWKDYDSSELLALLDGNRDRIEIAHKQLRARYGHSRPVCSGLKAAPPEQLLHATSCNLIPSILNVGLIPNGRRLVHMTTDSSYARSIHPDQSDSLCVLSIDTSICTSVGCAFFQATEHVWLSSFVPPAAIKLAEGNDDHSMLP